MEMKKRTSQRFKEEHLACRFQSLEVPGCGGGGLSPHFIQLTQSASGPEGAAALWRHLYGEWWGSRVVPPILPAGSEALRTNWAGWFPPEEEGARSRTQAGAGRGLEGCQPPDSLFRSLKSFLSFPPSPRKSCPRVDGGGEP